MSALVVDISCSEVLDGVINASARLILIEVDASNEKALVSCPCSYNTSYTSSHKRLNSFYISDSFQAYGVSLIRIHITLVP